MSFNGLAFDISQLPKVRTHTQLGRVGACSWYTPWDCYTSSDVQAAKGELEAAHNILLNYVNGSNSFLQDAQTNGAPSSIIAALQNDVNQGHSLVQQHSNLMSLFYAETGSGVAGLHGMLAGKGFQGISGLGNPVLLGFTVVELVTMAVSAAQSIFFYYLLNKVGDAVNTGAEAFKSNADSVQAKFKRDSDYYIAWKDAVSKGLTPPGRPDDESVKPTDWTTVALIGGSVVLAVMLLSKR